MDRSELVQLVRNPGTVVSSLFFVPDTRFVADDTVWTQILTIHVCILGRLIVILNDTQGVDAEIRKPKSSGREYSILHTLW